MGMIRLRFKTFIPMAKLRVLKGTDWFKGDDRDFDYFGSSRTRHDVKVDFSKKTVTEHKFISETHNLTTGETGRAPVSGLQLLDVKWINSKQVKYKVVCSSANPLVPNAPAIDYEFKVTLNSDGTGTFEGLHDGFPNYEVYIDTDNSMGNRKNVVYTFDIADHNETPASLFPPMEWGVSRRKFAV
ncbi:DUF3238 domain-containing protein [Brevibacillus laterosporus]|nr:DUF3238 domain-containing protein [Brevibacillus laterosporus]